MKPQSVRLMDVLILGPFMVWVGFRAKGIPPAAKWAMIGAGVGTVVYNAVNYEKVRRLELEPPT